MATPKTLLDTTVLIEFLRKKNKQNAILFQMVDQYQLYISVITCFEIEIGLKTEQHHLAYNKLLARVSVLPVDQICAEQAAIVYNYLLANNARIELADLLIGATALRYDLPVATLNQKHFVRIPELQLVDLTAYRN